MRRVLVTGGLGFIGSAFTRRLVSDGWEVRVEPIPSQFVHIDVLIAMLAPKLAAVCVEAASGGLVAWLMSTLPWLVYVGSGILAWTAGEMILSDSFAAPYVEASGAVGLALSAAVTALVLLAGFLTRRRARPSEVPEG